MRAIEVILFTQLMFVLMKSRISLNFTHLGSKNRSLGQIKEISSGHFREHISCQIDLKINQKVCIDKISDKFGSPGVKR